MPTDTAAMPRRDRSAAVKDAIRSAAKRLFTAQGYDATGIREIAAEANVNPAMVIRHFESKELLFIETVDGADVWRALLDGPVDDIGQRAVRRIVERRREELQTFGVIVRASGRPEIHARLRQSTITFFAEPLIGRIPGTDAQLRAHLFAAQLTGLMTALAVYDDEFLLEAQAGDIVARYGASLQDMLTGS